MPTLNAECSAAVSGERKNFCCSPPHLDRLLGPYSLPRNGFRDFFPGNKVEGPE